MGMRMSCSLPRAGSHLSQVCRAGPCPEPKYCPTCRICFPSASSSCSPPGPQSGEPSEGDVLPFMGPSTAWRGAGGTPWTPHTPKQKIRAEGTLRPQNPPISLNGETEEGGAFEIPGTPSSLGRARTKKMGDPQYKCDPKHLLQGGPQTPKGRDHSQELLGGIFRAEC